MTCLLHRHGFLEELSDSQLAKFQPNWFTGCRLGVSNVPSTCCDFHFEKTGEKDFWRGITRDEITDYNTKAVNVDAYQKRENNSNTAGKGYKRNRTTDKQFISKALLCSILLLSRKHLKLFATGSFHFEPSQLLLDTFSKSSTLPWKNRQQTASWSFS